MAETTRGRKIKKRNAARAATSPRIILLGLPPLGKGKLSRRQCLTCNSAREINDAVHGANRDSLWIACGAKSIDQLIQALRERLVSQRGRGIRAGNLLLLANGSETSIAILHGFFESIVSAHSSCTFLPRDQLIEVLSAPREQSRDLFIGGLVDEKSELLAMVRGDLERVAVPLSIFRPAGALKPDFGRFAVDDYGQTIRFGSYEASADFVLYAIDPEFRTRINAHRREQARGFGASLRRLRALRKIGRDAFGAISAKTIARIERDESRRPRRKTVQIICEVLEVDAGEIETY